MANMVNNKTGVPLEHYRQIYRAHVPEDMALCCGLEYAESCFSLVLLQRQVKLSFPGGFAIDADAGSELDETATILLLRYLTEGSKVDSSGRFLAYTEMPWGSTYSQQFAGRCVKRLAFSFGNDLGRFRRACEALGAVSVSGADAAYDVPFMENLTVRLLLWLPDDEFPPSAQVLFSDNFPMAFTAEDMAYVMDILIDRLKGYTLEERI